MLKAIYEPVCSISVGTVTNFSYTGSAQTYAAPCDGYYKMETWGSQGAANQYGNAGAYGAYAAGILWVDSTDIFYIYTGSQAGYNGGGTASQRGCCSRNGGNGGGSTDIRAVSGGWSDINSLRSRIIVAGAGGGAGGADSASNIRSICGFGHTTMCTRTMSSYQIGGSDDGGLGGDAFAGDGSYAWGDYKATTRYCIAEDGGNGSFGVGGTGGVNGGVASGCSYNDAHIGGSGGGGGGGWYGGGGGAGTSGWYGGPGGPGGGGSNYISGHSGSIAVTSASSTTPKCSAGSVSVSCSQSWTGYTFTNTLMIDGAGHEWKAGKTTAETTYYQMPNPSGGSYAAGVGHSENGAARITYLGTSI